MEKPNIIIVTHLLPDKPNFLKELNEIGNITKIIPKRKSINLDVLKKLEREYDFLFVRRNHLKEKNFLIDNINKKKKHILIDIGGYFAPIINELKNELGNNLLGVIEDTENGQQKYEKIKELNLPILSVARSPLKKMEDYLVGQSIFFSTESILREIEQLPNYLDVGIIGFGKIGRSIAECAKNKCISVRIYDTNPIQLVDAFSRGYNISSKKALLNKSKLIFCCTGNKSISDCDLEYIKNGCFISTATSKDDELDFKEIEKFQSIHINKNITKYFINDKHINLINDGNAANFIHNAVVGDFIKLVQKEILECTKKLINEELPNGIQTIKDEKRKEIAEEFILNYIRSDKNENNRNREKVFSEGDARIKC
jgi:adenosylhomocysteinase